MIDIADTKLVWFNADQVQLHAALVEQKLTSLDFPTFVKMAFHKEVDMINTKKEVDKNGECSIN